jgi:hypothetical protein
MRIDIVRADEGYFGIYVDGELELWGRAEPFAMLATVLQGYTVLSIESFATHNLGSYGDQAVGWESMPERFEDIPEPWWTNNPYPEPTFEEDGR